MTSEDMRKVVYSIRQSRLENTLGSADPWIHVETLYLALADLAEEVKALREMVKNLESHDHPVRFGGLSTMEPRWSPYDASRRRR